MEKKSQFLASSASLKKSDNVLTFPLLLDSSAIEAFIPHRDAMLFPDQVSVLAPDHYTGQAIWNVDSFVFQGHFPGRPIVPGVIILEAGAQIAGVGLAAADPKVKTLAEHSLGLLAAIRKCFFKRPVPPGLRLFYDLHIRHVADDVVNVVCDVSCELGDVATLEFVFAQASREALHKSLKEVEQDMLARTNKQNSMPLE